MTISLSAPDPWTCNIEDLLRYRASQQPGSVALIHEERHVTFAQLMALVDALAAGLQSRGLRTGDRIVARCAKSPESIALFFAALRLGVIYVPVNTAMTVHEAAHILTDAAPRLLVLTDESPEAFQAHFSGDACELSDLTTGATHPAPSASVPGGAAPSTMLYTSGTTGKPKGAVLSHRNLAVNFVLLAQAWGITPEDQLLHVLPVFHGHGLFLAAACPLIAGARLNLMSQFDIAQVLRHLPQTTLLMAVPTIYARLVEHPDFAPDCCGKLRLATSGSAALPLDVADAFRSRIGMTLLERYGSTEGGMIASNPLHGERKRGSVGKPFAHVDCRIMQPDGKEAPQGEVGRLFVKSPYVGLGYWRGENGIEPITDADGYFDTEDLVMIDPDGYLFIVGRDKDMIISGGFNVYPREVEAAIEQLSEVSEVAVIGVPHPDFGEAVLAAVTARSGMQVVEQDIQDRLRDVLTGYKRPKKIVVLDQMPRNAMGKILKRDIRTMFANTFSEG